ncbi:MAG TPA: ribosome recycling factor [Firmicutes bacterium]|jgi:ribosome recycling factor|nr:ribosome recycling factor [Bacillota bacterium]
MEEIIKRTDNKMEKSIEVFKKELATLRAGRAVPSLLDKVIVNYYNNPTPLNQLATITAPEPRLLVIQPWDKNVIGEIEKAILKSDLGLTPNNDGGVIRLPIPQLTEERRKELVRSVRKKAEETKVAIRNIRREANDLLKAEEKNGSISEDNLRKLQEEVQELTKNKTEKVDKVLQLKEKEIMEV